jgi:hypothetical protein
VLTGAFLGGILIRLFRLEEGRAKREVLRLDFECALDDLLHGPLACHVLAQHLAVALEELVDEDLGEHFLLGELGAIGLHARLALDLFAEDLVHKLLEGLTRRPALRVPALPLLPGSA